MHALWIPNGLRDRQRLAASWVSAESRQSRYQGAWSGSLTSDCSSLRLYLKGTLQDKREMPPKCRCLGSFVAAKARSICVTFCDSGSSAPTKSCLGTYNHNLDLGLAFGASCSFMQLLMAHEIK